VPVRINSDGLRDVEHAVAHGDRYRIIFLGDSFTFGWGVREADTFKSQLETALNQRYPTEIINFGIGNYNSEQEVNLFLEKGLKYHPDKVVVFYFINDAEPPRAKAPFPFLYHSDFITFFWSRTR
jgi:lysophospholipase L1-like esterase